MWEVSKVAETVQRKPFKSIHIDTEKGIYLLNGEEVPMVSRVDLEFINGKWSLLITRDELYVQEVEKKLRWVECNDYVQHVYRTHTGSKLLSGMRKMYERYCGADFAVCRRCAGNNSSWSKGLCDSHWHEETGRWVDEIGKDNWLDTSFYASGINRSYKYFA